MAETATPTPRARAKRKGNGPGHGGPAKGVGKGSGWGGPPKGLGTRPAMTAATQPTPEAKAAGQAKARTAAEAAKPHAVAMVDIWLTIAQDAGAPPMARIVAAEKLVERAEGKPTQDYNVKHSLTAATASDADLAAIAFAGGGITPAPEDDPT